MVPVSDAFDPPRDDRAPASQPPAQPAPAAAGHERRLTYQAYNYWAEAAGGKPFPDLRDLDPDSLAPFRARSFLVDFDGDDYGRPVFRHVGGAIEEEVGPVPKGTPLEDLPYDGLLGRVAEHCLKAVTEQAPVGYETDYRRADGARVLSRGILMPLGSGAIVDLLLGVANWKAEAAPPDDGEPASADEAGEAGEIGLQAVLAVARASAHAAQDAALKSREALYRALAEAYGFMVRARGAPAAYDALLRQAEITAQPRAPFTPVVKLIFGAATDKARLTEYAAVLSFLDRRALSPAEAQAFIAGFAGGLKAIVAAERAARRASRGGAAEPLQTALKTLAAARALRIEDAAIVAPGGEEYVLVLARRRSDRLVDPIAVVDEREKTIESAVKKAAKAVAADGDSEEAGPAPE